MRELLSVVLVSLLLWLLGLRLQVAAQVTISSFPTPLHVQEGNSFTLTCNYGSFTFRSWTHPRLGEFTESSGRLSIQMSSIGQAISSTLIVSNPTRSVDEGDYTCTVLNGDNQAVTQSIQALLYPTVRITTPSNQVQEAIEEQTATVTFFCEAEHHTRIAWKLFGEIRELTNSSDGHITVYPDRLVITNVMFSDNGTYVCTASNRVTTDYIYAHLVVNVGAGVTASPLVQTVAEGSDVEFLFTVTGSPLPNIEWFKDAVGGQELNFAPPRLTSELTTPITQLYRLSFASAGSEDTGTYICRVQNPYGGPVIAQVTLQLSDALGPPQMVGAFLVNQTKINVTWSPPDGSDTVDSYTVVWLSLNQSPRSRVVDGNALHYLIDDGLPRLTRYTVYVYASNLRRGKGSDSRRVNITTDAIAPAAPVKVAVMDFAPTSVRLEWIFGDDGGAPINGIRVTIVTLVGDEEFVDIDIALGQNSALVPGLMDNHQYRLNVQARNRIGFSPPLLSDVFHTPPPGRPGSPSHVTATWVSRDQAALVCWDPSEVGKPFVSYTIEVLEVKSNVTKLWKIAASVVKDNLPNCTAGYVVTGLLREVCYKFKVLVSNSQGQGYPSDYSEEFCLPPPTSEGIQANNIPALATVHIVIIAIGFSVLILAAVSVLFVWCICVRLRNIRKTAKFPTGSLPSEELRRNSARSDRVLLDSSNEEMRFHHQISIGSYTSSGSGNSVSGEETPNTGTTLIAENPFTFDAQIMSSRSQPNFTQDHPQAFPGGRANRSGSATLPVMNGSTLYPIPENDSPSQTLPFHATPTHYPSFTGNNHHPSFPYYLTPPPSSVGPRVREKIEDEVVEMTDNPLNIEFEKKMLAEGNVSRPNYSHEIDLPEDEPPPYVPPYRGDDMESEVSIAFGESCSQPPRSPQLSFQQQKNNRNRTNHDRSASHQSLREHAILTPASFDISNSDNELENEDTEFIDNEAYQKVQDSQFLTRVHEQGLGSGGVGSQNSMLGLGSGCSPITSIERGVTNYGSQQRMIEDDDSSKPRFKIKRGGRRGDVFEKVELHH